MGEEREGVYTGRAGSGEEAGPGEEQNDIRAARVCAKKGGAKRRCRRSGSEA